MKSSVWTRISTILLLLFVAAVVIGVYLLYLHVNGQALPFESLLSHAAEAGMNRPVGTAHAGAKRTAHRGRTPL